MINFLKKISLFGFGKDGLSHWFWQRITAIAMMFLFAWGIISLRNLIGNEEKHSFYDQTFHHSFEQWLSYPVNTILFIFLFVITIHHSTLGILNIFEDYINELNKKVFLIKFIKLLSFFLIVVSSFSILKFSFTSYF